MTVTNDDVAKAIRLGHKAVFALQDLHTVALRLESMIPPERADEAAAMMAPVNTVLAALKVEMDAWGMAAYQKEEE